MDMGSISDLPAFAHDAPAKFTVPPAPAWTYAQKVDATPEGCEWVAGEKSGFHGVDPATTDRTKLYALMTSGIVPRPIAFVSSISEDGVENLAPFSWFNMVAPDPPLISFAVRHEPRADGLKDTLRNVLKTKEFTVNIISHAFVENANATAVDAPAEISEWPLSGLTKEPSLKVKAARVKESAFSMECELFQSHDIVHPESGETTSTLVLGLVKYIHVRKDVLNERGLVDPVKLNAVARLGDITYARQGDLFRIPRPTWAANGEVISGLQ
ncbi:predicted protein [Sparassis crispa]|uniref:Flavin reductase like domain-containing protein n=1 Tax=Sparassis crispa TaxID=139825 RepID=A0A401GLH9_9APHY|nr:predicted protein [Sparassis crispa]GBE83041.1 predicted protein [Sparassis crispa]